VASRTDHNPIFNAGCKLTYSMLKISEEKRGRQAITLLLEGRIVGPWVDELRQLCESFARAGVKLTLNLEEVAFADDNGISLLVGLRARGVRLLHTTPFVEQQLKAIAPKAVA